MHPAQSIPAIFVLSLALGYLYEKTGSLVCTIAMHATFNAVNFHYVPARADAADVTAAES